MILSVQLTERYAERVGATDERTITFESGINLLVGPNGSGKSTVIEAMMNATEGHESGAGNKGVVVATSGRISGHFFDFEKGNLRTKATMSQGDLFFVQLGSKMRSHGEMNRFVARGLLDERKVEGGAVFLDEPDQALDFDGVVQLVSWLRDCKAAQAIVAVHHPLLVLQPDFNVIEMREGYRDEMAAALAAILETR